MVLRTGTLNGTFENASQSAGAVQARTQGSTALVKSYIEVRLKQLIPQAWNDIQRAWREAWLTYQKTRGVPRWYINTESIPQAALTDAMTSLQRTLKVEVALGRPIRISGSIELNPDAVRRWHNQNRTRMSVRQEKQVRWGGQNPKSLGIKGSFQHTDNFLLDFLLAGPNKTAGRLPAVTHRQAHRGKGAGMYLNVFTALGNSYRGIPIPTQRAGAAATGDRLMWYFAYHLGFSPSPTRVGTVWTVQSTLGGMRRNTPLGTLMTVVMQEVRTKFPQIEFAEK